jgi:hypothetical protein
MADLFMGHAEWLAYGSMRFPNDRESLVLDGRKQSHVGANKLRNCANQIRRSARKGDNPFPLLKNVIMTGLGDSSWGCMRGDYEFECAYTHNRINIALLGLPSVQHYCQTSAMGPFSLPSQILKPLHPPKVVTFHYAFPEITWPNHFKPPLVLGAINRYIQASPTRIATPIPLEPARVDIDCPVLLANVYCVMAGRDVVIQELAPDSSLGSHPDIPGAALVPLTQVSLDGTFIEFYNTIKNVEQKEVPMTSAESRTAPSWPLSRKTCEALDDFGNQLWGEQWTGRVKTRNKEEIPACPACGFDGVKPVGALHEWMEGLSTDPGLRVYVERGTGQ